MLLRKYIGLANSGGRGVVWKSRGWIIIGQKRFLIFVKFYGLLDVQQVVFLFLRCEYLTLNDSRTGPANFGIGKYF